ncbi:MAG: hypothetical protein ABSG15_08640 [FCB group bacterium]|jgi:hypothetical protein
MKDKLHIIVIFSIIVGIIIIAQIADLLLKPASFDEFGHYRWNAIGDIQSQKSVNQSINTCKECHNKIYQLHEKDAHYNVPCVDCHGAGNLHVAYHKGGNDAKNITSMQAVMKKEYNLEGCLFCHRKLAARPSDFPQIDKEQHFKFLHVTDSTTKCTECHSPHEPVFLLTDVNQSRLHPIVYRCNDCHNKAVKNSYSDVPNHPKIFECKDCHSDIVNDFNKRPHHNYVECRTCHLFHKEDETIGRIYKNGNAKFCLLCHEKKSFKDDKYPPKIEWPAHISKIENIKKTDEKICLNCHANQIHKMALSNNKSPHGSNWRSEHKNFAFNKADKKMNTSCSLCHQQDFCFSCHKVEIPHPEDFADKHKEIIQKKGKALCFNCHKTEFCKGCHD